MRHRAAQGLSVRDLPLETLRAMYLGLGVHFGRPDSQSAMGDLVGDVVDVGGKDRPRTGLPKQPRAEISHRPLRSCRHALHPPGGGGRHQRLRSALAVHNTILAERPDLLAPL